MTVYRHVSGTEIMNKMAYRSQTIQKVRPTGFHPIIQLLAFYGKRPPDEKNKQSQRQCSFKCQNPHILSG